MDFNSEQQAMILFFCFTLSCLLIFTTARSRWSSRRATTLLPPGPPRLPIIGNIHQVGKNPHQSFADLSKTYGPVMGLKLGCLNLVVISSPDAAREVLKAQDHILSARYFNEAIRCVNHQDYSVAWLHPSYPLWRLLRKISVTHLFSQQRIEATTSVRMKKVQELINFMSESSEREEVVNISRASFVTTLNIISNLLFSVDLGHYDSSKSSVFQDLVTGIMVSSGNPDLANYFPITRFLDLQGNRKKMKECSERLFSVFGRLYDDRIKENSLRTNDKSDFLDALIDHNKRDEEKLDVHQIQHLLLDMFLAGTDSSSSTVEWALAELIRNPTKMKKAQNEIDRVVGQNGVVQESDLSQMSYLQAAVKETFRLHPAAPLLLPRIAETDVDILNFHVPKDTEVLVNVWAIGRDPNTWENPTEFEPERFMGKKNEIDVKGTDYELTPFGAGKRICAGLPLVMKTVPLMLASLLYSFDWKLPNGDVPEDLDMSEDFGLTLHKTNPLHAVPIKKRIIVI